MAGLTEKLRLQLKEAYKRWQRDSKLYEEHKRKKREGLPTGLIPVENERDRLMNKPDQYGRRPRKYKI